MSARRSRSRRRTIGAIVVAAAVSGMLLAGCASPIAAAPSPGSTSSPSPSPTAAESASPEATDAAARGISTTCEELLAAPSLSEVTGSASPTESDALWATAAEVAGGIVCGFDSDDLAGTIIAIPDERAGSLASSAASECAPSYDTVECIGTGSADGMTVTVSFLGGGQTQSETDTVARLRDAALDAVLAAERTPLGEPAAEAASCADLAEIIDPSAVLRADEVFPTPIMEGDFPFDRRIVESADLVRACDWSELTDFRELQVVIVPGGAERWDEVNARFGGTASMLDGADAAEVQEDYRVRLLVRATDDLILVEGRSVDRGSALTIDDLRSVARELVALS